MPARSPLLALAALALVASGPGAAAQAPLTPVWVRMADDDGVLDTDLDRPTSTENAEFSPDGTHVASVAKGDGSIRLWDAATGTEVWRVDPEVETEAVTFTRDGRFVVAGGESTQVWVFRREDGVRVQTLDREASVEGLRFSHDGTRLATGDEAGTVTVWDTSADDPTDWPTTPLAELRQGPDQDSAADPAPRGTHADVNQVDWTEDDGQLVSAGRNGEVKLWDASDWSAPAVVIGRLASSVKAVRLSAGDALVAAFAQAGGGTASSVVGVWERATGREVARVPFPDVRVGETVEWTPDGRYLLAGGTFFDHRGEGALYLFETADLLANEAPRPAAGVGVFNQEYLHFSPDGTRLVTSHADGSLRLWRYEARATSGEAAPPAFEVDVLGDPTRGRLALRLTGPGGAVRIEVVDVQGRLVLSATASASGRRDLDVSAFAPGLYLGRAVVAGRGAVPFRFTVAR